MMAAALPAHGAIRRKDQLVVDAIRRVVPEVMRQRGLDPGRIVCYCVGSLPPSNLRWCVVELDRMHLGRIAQYAHPDVAHQIQTALGGLFTHVVNERGLGYAILLDRPKPLPARVPFNPAWWEPGVLRLGMLPNGDEVRLPWTGLLSLLVAGMPSSGKSSLIRNLSYHALRDGCHVVCIDTLNNTLPMLDGHPAVTLYSGSEADVRRALAGVTDEIDRRVRLFSELHAHGHYPDSLARYNAIVGAEARLPEILLIVEEYNHVLDLNGGTNGGAARALKSILEVGRKYGVKVVIAAQAVTVEEIGTAKKLVGAVACFNLGPHGAAAVRQVFGRADTSGFPPGRCFFSGVGLMQTYWLPGEQLIDLRGTAAGGPRMPPLYLRLATFAHQHHGGKLTIPIALDFFAAEPAAPDQPRGQKWVREQINAMEMRGWLVRSPADRNARLLSDQACREVEAALARARGPQPLPPHTGALSGAFPL